MTQKYNKHEYVAKCNKLKVNSFEYCQICTWYLSIQLKYITYLNNSFAKYF